MLSGASQNAYHLCFSSTSGVTSMPRLANAFAWSFDIRRTPVVTRYRASILSERCPLAAAAARRIANRRRAPSIAKRAAIARCPGRSTRRSVHCLRQPT